MITRLWALLLLACAAVSAESLFETGMERYNLGDYHGAFEAFLEAYGTSQDEDAAYMVAVMYEKGEGVETDRDAAAAWYRFAAQGYFKSAADSSLHRENKRLLTAYRDLDPVDDNETAETIRKVVVSDFGLKTFQANYLLPFGYRNGVYDSYVPSDHYTNMEAEMQLSFRLDVLPNLFGLNETYSAAYTQRSFWQVYADSAPFRETNYQPEVFVTFPTAIHKIPIKAFSVGIAHQSNGQGNITEQDFGDVNLSSISDTLKPYLRNRSRSWNYAWTEALFQTGSLFAELKLWYRFKEKKGEDDNPDLIDYMGHGSLRLLLPYGKSMSELLLRQNFRTGKGAQQLTWSYPLSHRENVFWFFKAFTGYGESLIDYNNYVTKFAVGFSFSR